jgi:hypothetical protein
MKWLWLACFGALLMAAPAHADTAQVLPSGCGSAGYPSVQGGQQLTQDSTGRTCASVSGTVSAVNGQTSTTTTTIQSGGSLSTAIDLGTAKLGRIAMPASWTAANVTFQSSPDNVVYNDLYDSNGNEYTITTAASRGIIVPHDDFLSVRYLKIRSGTSAIPVAQGADRVITLVLVP